MSLLKQVVMTEGWEVLYLLVRVVSLPLGFSLSAAAHIQTHPYLSAPRRPMLDFFLAVLSGSVTCLHKPPLSNII